MYKLRLKIYSPRLEGVAGKKLKMLEIEIFQLGKSHEKELEFTDYFWFLSNFSKIAFGSFFIDCL